ncbi:Protein piwi [Orchesella cincta]|uniref:Protein piwi n=1 Tax=Orchesella cincta TaxID=48709 RepID=A0A1D2M6C3_ORCCI|nr:Protein piwi [Orchesella cincta]
MRATRDQVGAGQLGMELDGKLVELKGRILAKEVVSFAKGTHQVDDKGDFTMAFRSQQMLTSVNLTTWVIIVPQRDFAGVDNLVRTMTKVAAPLSMAIGNPKQIIKVPDARSGSYLSAMEDALNLKPQMIFVILPNNKAELYNVVKKRLAVERSAKSVLPGKNVTSKGLMSIATKVVVQMNAKLGGEPWTLKLPLKSCMFVDSRLPRSQGSKGGSAATISKRSTASFRSESSCIVTVWAKSTQGSLQYRADYTHGRTHEDVRKRRKVTPTPHFHRRIQTGQHSTHDDEDEPPKSSPGTIVDEVVTLPERYDFYLISCAARQGTVSPCSYNVLQDENNFDADRIQLITTNSATCTTTGLEPSPLPAPCQYAHKLALPNCDSLCGQASPKLSRLLHFL